MKPSIIKTDSTMKELTEHGTTAYPILISCGLTLSLNKGIVSWHWHDDFELTYVVSGHLKFSVGTNFFLLNPGAAVFINSKVLHQVKPFKNERPIYYSYAFASELLSESMQSLTATKYLLPLMHNNDFPHYIFRPQILWEKLVLSHIQALNQAAGSTGFEREFEIQHCLQAVFIDMIRNIPDICTNSVTSPNNQNDSIMKIMLYIKKHYSNPIALSDMADEANISISSCNRLFRKLLNMTPFEYLLDFRISQSKQLLNHSNKSITEIASICGFHDVSYYCKVFRKHNCISPHKYRTDGSR